MFQVFFDTAAFPAMDWNDLVFKTKERAIELLKDDDKMQDYCFEYDCDVEDFIDDGLIYFIDLYVME